MIRDLLQRIKAKWTPGNRYAGQGVVEYAGAMVIAATIVAALCTATQTNNWMYNAYNNLYATSGNLLMNAVNNLD